MAGKQTSFEERLARIEQNRVASAPPPVDIQRPPRRSGGKGGTGKMIFGFVGIFIAALVVIGGVTFVLSNENSFAALAERASADEIAGTSSAATALLSADQGASAAMNIAVNKANQRLESGALTAEEARKHQAFVNRHDGKSPADMVRGNMRSMLIAQAKAAGQPQLAANVAADLDACRSTTCMALVEAKFLATLDSVTAR